MFPLKKDNPKNSFALGVITGVLVVVVLGGVYMLGAQQSGGLKLGSNNPSPSPAAPTPTQPSGPTQDPSKVVVTDKDHVRGNPNAKVTMVEFSDFECPFCSRFAPTVEQVLDEFGDDVRLVYKHFPLRSIHPNAQKAAEASECAADQGKFWEYHDEMFAKTTAGVKLTIDELKTTAANLGLNTSRFNSCLDNGDKASDVEEDYQMGIAAGVSGTPATFIGDQVVPGALPFASVQGIINSQL